MIRFAAAGKLDYFQKGLRILSEHQYVPQLKIESGRIIDQKEQIEEKKLELLVCLAHPYILRTEEIKLFPKGCINVHAGIPDYCGRHPVNWMIIDGVREIPVAIHYMSEEIDGGDIIVEDSFLVERQDDYNSIIDKITDISSRLLLSAVRQIEAGTVYRKKQIKPRKYPKRRGPEDSKVNWNMTSVQMHNFISALVEPMPCAFSYLEDGEKIHFKRSYRGDRAGRVLAETTDGRYVISTRDGVVLVETDKKLKVNTNLDIKK